MRQALDTYDDMPKYMKQYLRNYGWHFNKALCNYAVSLMKKGGQKLEPVSKEYVDKTLEQYNIQLEKNIGCDYIFVANMCKADYLGKSVPNENYLAQYIKDVLDDVDGYDGIAFNRWYADTCRKGVPINWYKFK